MVLVRLSEAMTQRRRFYLCAGCGCLLVLVVHTVLFAGSFDYGRRYSDLMLLSSSSNGGMDAGTVSGSSVRATYTSDAPPESLTSSNTGLAFRESYGFFDDVSDASWKLRREHARNFVQFMDPSNPEKGFDDVRIWYLNNLQPSFACPHIFRVGGHGDGPKFVCSPHRLLEYRRNDKDPCLIYSVGSQGKYEFEDALIELLRQHGDQSCEIHVFDMGPDYGRPGDPERNNIHYHPWGITSGYDKEYADNVLITLDAISKEDAKLLSLPETMRKLGHTGRTIDFLKMDCEGCEWASYKDWITLDIRQIFIETHGVPSPHGPNKYYHKAMNVSDFFDAFEDNGFAMFSKETNVHGACGHAIEFSYIKLAPNFWDRRGKTARMIRQERRIAAA